MVVLCYASYGGDVVAWVLENWGVVVGTGGQNVVQRRKMHKTQPIAYKVRSAQVTAAGRWVVLAGVVIAVRKGGVQGSRRGEGGGGRVEGAGPSRAVLAEKNRGGPWFWRWR